MPPKGAHQCWEAPRSPYHHSIPSHLGFSLRVGGQHSIGIWGGSGKWQAAGGSPVVIKQRAGTQSENLKMPPSVGFPSCFSTLCSLRAVSPEPRRPQLWLHSQPFPRAGLPLARLLCWLCAPPYEVSTRPGEPCRGPLPALQQKILQQTKSPSDARARQNQPSEAMGLLPTTLDTHLHITAQ